MIRGMKQAGLWNADHDIRGIKQAGCGMLILIKGIKQAGLWILMRSIKQVGL